MKDFKKFLEEITIKGNPGIPGEGERRRGDSEYLSDTERRAKRNLGLTGRERPEEIGYRLMQLMQSSQRFIRGKEEQLEQLATQIILSNYSDILDGVELDIKILRSGGEVANFMEDEGQPGDPPPPPQYRRVDDEETKKKIHRAKISNNIIQGEAKNTKHILHTEEVKAGLREIYGRDADQVFNTWDEITKLADKMDWIIPIRIKADMMERAPEGMAGAVKVDWQVPPPANEEDDDDNKGNAKDDEKDKELSDKLLQDMIDGNEFDPRDLDQFQDIIGDSTPIIRARGVDFPMLLHEAVKGIYELIAAISLPPMGASEEELKEAETIMLNVSSYEDEAEDFRTGPEIAADFRDFINQNPAATANTRAYIFGKMLENLTPDEFLNLFRGILNKTADARAAVDEMIDEVNAELREYEIGEFTQKDVNIADFGIEEKDISQLSQKDLQAIIDTALEDGDFEKVKKLSVYLKEGREIYLREIQMIKENHQYHKK